MIRIAAALYGFAGAGLVAFGLYQWWPPAAWIFGGAFVIADAWQLSGRIKSDSPEPARSASAKPSV